MGVGSGDTSCRHLQGQTATISGILQAGGYHFAGQKLGMVQCLHHRNQTLQIRNYKKKKKHFNELFIQNYQHITGYLHVIEKLSHHFSVITLEMQMD